MYLRQRILDVLIDPETDHNAKRNSQLLQCDEGTPDLAGYVSIHQIKDMNRLTEERIRNCKEERSWTGHQLQYH